VASHFKQLIFSGAVLAAAAGISCAPIPTAPEAQQPSGRTAAVDHCHTSIPAPYQPGPAEAERDAIYTLVAYAVVYKDWQTTGWQDPDHARGYNIGGVLVDPARPAGEQLLCWARNSVIKTRNGTQHGEVRLITNYLDMVPATKLKGFKLYTTLEPCAMCSGMMTLQSLQTVVYGQTDPGFGGAIERLTLNSSGQPKGWCPYPRGVQSSASPLPIRQRIDSAYAQVQGQTGIVRWLASDQARSLYAEAWAQFQGFRVQFAENRQILEQALSFLEQVSDHYAAMPYTVACTAN